MYRHDDPRSLELYSSAFTLSDMEVFIFPELMYALTLANCMSPLLWSWRSDPWFRDRTTMSQYRLLQRVKQYIMDHFVFNLDLETWGLTTKQKEIGRFRTFVDPAALAQSNALFGYEGDKYYFDIDIRRHFGLDRYTTDVIPYWKTETLEAMHAFRYKPGYRTGAGECVSLSTLYAAALAVVARISPDDIYLMATPLHSQNFIDIRDGVITNNRRIVTKAMWFNGTELSSKARRALQHERVTIVAHRTGYVHVFYPEATMDRDRYEHFVTRLRSFLRTDIDYGVLTAFLRDRKHLQRCFQFSHECCGKPRYIEAEKVYAYEHGSKSRVGDETQTALIHEIDEDEFYPEPLEGRILLDELEVFFRNNPVSVDCRCNIERLKQHLRHTCFNLEETIEDLIAFSRIEPRLPGTDKQWISSRPVECDIEKAQSYREIIAQLEPQRALNQTVDLAFAAYRDMSRTPWRPFMKAALERNPVCIVGAHNLSIAEVADRLYAMADESIYDGTRVAQPDEVWNFGRGDGLEKAICLLTIAAAKRPDDFLRLEGDERSVVLRVEGREYRFSTSKGLPLPSPDDCAFRFNADGLPMEPSTQNLPSSAESFE